MKKYNLKAANFMRILDRLAEEMHGEFGFSTLPEEQMYGVMAHAFKELEEGPIKPKKVNPLDGPWLEVASSDFITAKEIIKKKKIAYTLNKKHPHTFFFKTKSDYDKSFKACNLAQLIIW